MHKAKDEENEEKTRKAKKRKEKNEEKQRKAKEKTVKIKFPPIPPTPTHEDLPTHPVFLSMPTLSWFQERSQERKGHINSRTIPGHRPGVPGTPGGTNRGLPAGVPGISCYLLLKKRSEKGIFAGTRAGCPRDTRPPRGFSEILCDFFLCAFSAPYEEPGFFFSRFHCELFLEQVAGVPQKGRRL